MWRTDDTRLWQQPLTGVSQGYLIYAGGHNTDTQPVSDSNKFWDAFDVAPLIAAAAVLFVLLLRPLLTVRPQWLRTFVRETQLLEVPWDSKSRWLVPPHAATLLLLATLGLGLQIFRSAMPLLSLNGLYAAAAWIVVVVLILITRPKTTSVSVLLIMMAICISTLVRLTYEPEPWHLQGILGIGVFLVSLLGLVVVLCMPMRQPRLSPAGISKPFDKPDASLRSPEDRLSLWQWMTVSWMAPLISIGSKRQLNDEDVWDLPYVFKHRRLTEAFRLLKGSVIRRLLVANGLDLLITTALGVINLVSNLIEPVLLQQLLRAMSAEHGRVRGALTWAMLSLVVRLVAAQADVFSLWYCRRAYERSRGEMITMLYEKTLRRKIILTSSETSVHKSNTARGSIEHEELSDPKSKTGPMANFRNFRRRTTNIFNKAKAEKLQKAQQPASMGKILNLMRGDAYEVAQRFWEFPDLIKQPLGVVLSIVLIWKIIGWPSLAGVVVLLIAQGIIALFARVLVYWETVRRSATDTKLEKISRFVEAIRHLRWYAWHEHRLDDILEARQYELYLRVITGIWQVLIEFTTSLSGTLFPVAAFWALTSLAGVQLSVDIAFPALDLFNMLLDNLRRIPGLITVILNAYVSVNRLESYMQEPEKEDQKDNLLNDVPLQITSASFAWPGTVTPVLRKASAVFPQGITVVYGEVAAGKTALLQAILGELDHLDGQVSVPNKALAYCAQAPWLQSMSIRENILFSYPYEEQRYKEVLRACALIPDLAGFPAGDLSNIGENGVGLSGGQRARVALARAVYSPADIVLLDDPLSALDHQTAEFIVKNLLGGPIMHGRTVVLITHRTQLCHNIATQWLQVADGSLQVTDPERSGFEARINASSKADTEANDQERIETEAAAVPEKFIEEEHRAHGDVQLKVYWEYIKAGKLKFWAILALLASLYRALDTLETWFIKEWGEAYKTSSATGLFDRLPPPQVNITPWLQVFLGLALIVSFTYLVSASFILVIVYAASKRMFRDVMHHVANATFRFYDVTPVGRLMNRLTSDMSTVDGNINRYFMTVVFLIISWTTSVIIIASVAPLFLLFGVILTILFVLIFLRFLPTSQSLRRLEMTSLTPLLSNFGALSEGLTTVRAFCAEHQFIERVIAVTDTFQKMDHFYWSLQAWLMLRFDVLSATSTFVLTLLAIYSDLTPGLTAFVLIAAAKFVTATHLLCRYYGQLQMDFVSVERVVEMLHLPLEPPGKHIPPAWWPTSSGDIVFDNVTLKYTPASSPALKNATFRIPGGKNCAIVGRTGSGKSTLVGALLGTLEPTEGDINVCDVSLRTVHKNTLRKRVTFLAQGSPLFEGTVRSNVDPFNECTDTEIERVLRLLSPPSGPASPTHSSSESVAIGTGLRLNFRVLASGTNLSAGQRQIVGLARAILRKSRIVILDEATSALDSESVKRVGRVLASEGRGVTRVQVVHWVGGSKKGKGKDVENGNRRAADEGQDDDAESDTSEEEFDWVVRLDKGRVVYCGPPEEEGMEAQSQEEENRSGK